MSDMSMSSPRNGVSRRRMTTVSSPRRDEATHRRQHVDESGVALHRRRRRGHARTRRRRPWPQRRADSWPNDASGSTVNAVGLVLARLDQDHVDPDTSTSATPNDAITDGGDAEVRRRDRRCRQPQVQTAGNVRPDQHQRGDVLARHVARHHHGVGAAQWAGDGDRQVPPRLARLDRGAEGDERVVQRCHRAPAQRRITVDRERPAAERGERGDEPRRRAGELGRQVERSRPGDRLPVPTTSAMRTPSIAADPDAAAETLETVEHRRACRRPGRSR